jgi:hypothetical protein
MNGDIDIFTGQVCGETHGDEVSQSNTAEFDLGYPRGTFVGSYDGDVELFIQVSPEGDDQEMTVRNGIADVDFIGPMNERELRTIFFEDVARTEGELYAHDGFVGQVFSTHQDRPLGAHQNRPFTDPNCTSLRLAHLSRRPREERRCDPIRPRTEKNGIYL